MISKILKRRSLQEVNEQVDNLTTIIKDRISTTELDNIPELNSLRMMMRYLSEYLEARTLMQSPRYEVWESEGKPGTFEDCLG